MESVLTRGRDLDCPHSQPPLAAEDNFNPECAEERLCPAQPASECSLVATVYPYLVRRSGIRIRSVGHICRSIMGRGRGQGREAMASASIGYDGCGRSS